MDDRIIRQMIQAVGTPVWVYDAAVLRRQVALVQDALRLIAVREDYTVDLAALRDAIAADRRLGLLPFAVVGNAGTVNTGAVDDLTALAAICREEGLHFHVDGAFGAMAALAPELRPRLAGMELADSVAFDLHKWGYFPIEAGCVLVRDADGHRGAFAVGADYLAKIEGGIAGRGRRMADLGLQLSRGFKALKVWIGLKADGADRLGRLIGQNVRQAAYLARLVERTPELELLAPVPLNIVCLRFRGLGPRGDLDALNRKLLVRIQESGVAVPSSTVLGGRFALRVCITNHRTRLEDLDLFVEEVVRLGRALN